MKSLAKILNEAAEFIDDFARSAHSPEAARVFSEMATAVSVASELLKEDTHMGQTADRVHELKKALASATADAKTLADLRTNNRILDDSDVAALAEPDLEPPTGDTADATTGDTATTVTTDAIAAPATV